MARSLRKKAPAIHSIAGAFAESVKAVYPIALEVIYEIHHRAYRPCDGVRPVDVAQLAEGMAHICDIADTQDAPHAEHYKHRHERLACASAHRRNGVRVGKQEEEQ